MSFGRLSCLSFALALTAAAASAHAASVVDEAASALVKSAEPVTWIEGEQTGSAWKSVIQSPNYQTDRDMGAASVGMGLLSAYDVTGNSAYLHKAEDAGDFLIAAQIPADSGRWPDYFNPTGPAAYGFTSFDDGAAGIADFLWRLYEQSGNARYEGTALAAMNWLASKAEAPQGKVCPSVCFWHWQDPGGKEVFTGMGQGVAGIASAFDAFAGRRAKLDPVGSAHYEQYALAAANWLESQMVRVKLADGEAAAKMPEQPGSRVFDTGYRSGSAGDALLFYQLYRSTGRAQYRRDGDLLMAWVRSVAESDHACAGAKWPIQTEGYGAKLYATGIGEGAAGIGWVALQSYRLLIAREPQLAIKDLELARAAGDWLLSSCAAERKGVDPYWPENQGRHIVHTSLENGAAGVGIFLYDLYGATGSPSYRDGAEGALSWIQSNAFHGHGGSYWCEHVRDGQWHLCGEPSWYWGAAGILDAAARFSGWPLDIPGEQPGFDSQR